MFVPFVFNASSNSFLSRLPVQQTARRSILYNDMINALSISGVWAKLDALYIFAASDRVSARQNLVQNAYHCTEVGSMTFLVDNYFKGDGVSATLDTGFNPSVAVLPNYALNSASAFAWYITNGLALQGGIVDSGGGPLFVGGDGITNHAKINSANLASTPNAATTGLFGVSRFNANSVSVYRNGSLVVNNPAAASTGLPTADLMAAGGSATEGFDTCEIALAGFGSALTDTDHLTLYNAIFGYLHGIGLV